MRVLVGVSGGLDSTYAALKLKKEGYDVEAALLVMHEHTDLSSAKEAMASLGITLHVIDCKDRFSHYVKSNFVDEYSKGRTPNPCIVCNRYVKFRCLYEYARGNGFDKIATGHYSAVVEYKDEENITLTLKRAKDLSKDQTYMLSSLESDILCMLLLPLSDMTKSEIKKEAAALGLVAAEKPESQEICFLPEGNYPEYIESVLGKFQEGDFVNDSGEILGRHKGIIRYTVGQRKGLGISSDKRLFVKSIDVDSNIIRLGNSRANVGRIQLCDMNYLGISDARDGRIVFAKVQVRYRATPIFCELRIQADNTATVLFDGRVEGVTLGQRAVLYDGDTLLCSGVINKAE